MKESTPNLDALTKPFDRRGFLKRSVAAMGASAMSLSGTLASSGREDLGGTVIDTNAYLGVFPYRDLPLGTPFGETGPMERFGEAMAERSLSTWVASFEGLLARDYDQANERLAAMVTSSPEAERQFQAFGALNPKVPGWRETLRRLHNDFRMRGIRLYPGYHGYSLDDPDFASLIEAAAERNLIVQIVVRMEDVRTHPPALSIPDVDPRPLLELLPQIPGVRLQLLNAMRSLSDTLLLARLSILGVRFDIAMLEGMSGIARMMERVPEIQLCYGSYAPFFYPESSALKIEESAPDLDSRNLAAIRSHHAENLLLR